MWWWSDDSWALCSNVTLAGRSNVPYYKMLMCLFLPGSQWFIVDKIKPVNALLAYEIRFPPYKVTPKATTLSAMLWKNMFCNFCLTQNSLSLQIWFNPLRVFIVKLKDVSIPEYIYWLFLLTELKAVFSVFGCSSSLSHCGRGCTTIWSSSSFDSNVMWLILFV